MAELPLDGAQIERVKSLAAAIASDVQKFIDVHSTVSVERTVLRLYGVDGTHGEELPIPNYIVDLAKSKNLLENGISPVIAATCLVSGRDPYTTASMVSRGELELADPKTQSLQKVRALEMEFANKAVSVLDRSRKTKALKKSQWPAGQFPWRYLIVATGNIYEDRTQAEAAALAGADVVAVIRTTAQSLLDHIPFGATTQGFGGTMATQENFRIMRAALDKASEKLGRYIHLTNYSSGLCMAEIAACAAIEDLDMLLNDSMYGILFRDINMQRTFVDQFMSRLICARAGIYINTGEDNYLTTADAIEEAYTVTSSQLINEAMAVNAGLDPELMGLGHAYEINPKVPNALLYEIAHAQLARQLFPRSPLKYMPPTKYKSTDIFFSHCLDTMFNFVSITTNQGIHLAGMPTEAIHTPLMMDRYQSLDSINYVFNIARDLHSEIEFKSNGFIAKRANEVLDQSEKFLLEIIEMGGLMKAIENGRFANIKRPYEGGKGLSGVFKKSSSYSNPILELLVGQKGVE